MKKYTNPELEMIRISADVTAVSGGMMKISEKKEMPAEEGSAAVVKTYGGLGWNTNQ